MTKEEIIELARQADFLDYELDDGTTDAFDKRYEAFAVLVASAECEECKKLCTWKTGNQFVDEAVAVCYRAIDQRGQE